MPNVLSTWTGYTFGYHSSSLVNFETSVAVEYQYNSIPTCFTLGKTGFFFSYQLYDNTFSYYDLGTQWSMPKLNVTQFRDLGATDFLAFLNTCSHIFNFGSNCLAGSDGVPVVENQFECNFVSGRVAGPGVKLLLKLYHTADDSPYNCGVYVVARLEKYDHTGTSQAVWSLFNAHFYLDGDTTAASADYLATGDAPMGAKALGIYARN